MYIMINYVETINSDDYVLQEAGSEIHEGRYSTLLATDDIDDRFMLTH